MTSLGMSPRRVAPLTPPEVRHASPSPTISRNVVIVIVPILLVLITFLFWYQTWFGRPLTDREMGQYLADTRAPHKIQHALAQLSSRMARGDATARRWYPQILAMAHNQEPQLRQMAAWAMGQDNHSEEFHEALRVLLADPEPLVRWNAALSLVRFGDAASAPQLRTMLEPYTVVAPQSGTLSLRVKAEEAVRSRGVVARIRTSDGAKPLDVISPVAGTVERLLIKDGARILAGEELAVLAPGESQVWESLRALYLVGQPQDLEDVERYARGVSGMPDKIQAQAKVTAQAIRQRAAQKEG